MKLKLDCLAAIRRVFPTSFQLSFRTIFTISIASSFCQSSTFYAKLLRRFPLSCFATMPEPEPRPVICFTLVHLSRLRFNVENILATSLPSSRALAGYMFRFRSLVPAQSHLGEHCTMLVDGSSSNDDNGGDKEIE